VDWANVNLGQDSFARYTAPQALGSVGGEVLSHRFIAFPCDRSNVAITLAFSISTCFFL
jgi:hypothetical protein